VLGSVLNIALRGADPVHSAKWAISHILGDLGGVNDLTDLNTYVAGVLEAFVIKTADPQRSAAVVPAGKTVQLSADYHLIPLTKAVKAALGGDSEPRLGFLALTPRMVSVAEELSRNGHVAYCHLEFHGGTGFQAAVVWVDGQIDCGPVFTANQPAERVSEAYQLVEGRDRIGDMAINVVLRDMGVTVGDSLDEFQALGLDQHRWTEDWIG